jgi:hypothetical protein
MLYFDAKPYVYVVLNVLANGLRVVVVRSFATFSHGCQHGMLPGWIENFSKFVRFKKEYYKRVHRNT